MPELISRAEAKSQGLKRYFTGEPCQHGHIAERFVSSRGCVPCSGATRDRCYRNTLVAHMLRKARGRAAKKGVPFALTEADIQIPTHCPVFGWPLVIGNAPGTTEVGGQSPSLDRIIPALGYVPGNVLIVSNLANSIKHTATPDQILAVGNFYKRLFEERAAFAA